MKTRFLVLLYTFNLAVCTNAEDVCYYPEGCEIISSEFSTGGGKKAFYIMELDCKLEDGSIVKYIDVEFSAAGMLNMGRVSVPRKIVFKEHSKDELECDY